MSEFTVVYLVVLMVVCILNCRSPQKENFIFKYLAFVTVMLKNHFNIGHRHSNQICRIVLVFLIPNEISSSSKDFFTWHLKKDPYVISGYLV